MASSYASRPSVLQYFYQPKGAEGHKCGYCSGKDGNICNGMWLHTLSCEDYEVLVDRGWRRCGQYGYKPIMNRTCCPLYAITCDALKFNLSKSQKTVLIKLRKYLETDSVKDPPTAPPPSQAESREKCSSGKVAKAKRERAQEAPNRLDESTLTDVQPPDEPDPPLAEEKTPTKVPSQDSDDTRTKPTPVELPKRKKKKKTPTVGATAAAHKAPAKKTVEDFISLDTPMIGKAHKLEVKLVQSAPRTKEFEETFAASHALFKKYQMVVHNEKEEDCSEEHYTGFLVDSPLQRTPTGGTGPALGSYHQQYYLDGKLVMVGVVDLLPRYVSSVYVFYDPAIMFLSPGVVSALYEIAYTRQLHALIPSVEVYCMGYYVHNCQKMRYKGQYRPSFLLCPETYRWQPIEKCVPKLDQSKYARLEEEEGHALEPVEDYLDRVYIWNGVKDPRVFGSDRGKTSRQTALVKEYATLVGSRVSTRAILYCN